MRHEVTAGCLSRGSGVTAEQDSPTRGLRSLVRLTNLRSLPCRIQNAFWGAHSRSGEHPPIYPERQVPSLNLRGAEPKTLRRYKWAEVGDGRSRGETAR
jgi:hypothetical protein